MDEATRHRTSVAPAGIVLGIGLGGFFDGIFLHQIFQVHAMLSGKIPLDSMENMQTNMVADGLFHVVTLIATLVGVAMLWKTLNERTDARHPGLALVGYMLAGWGWFNLVEGLIDHQILGLHHVIERLGLSIWDWLFLASGVLLIVVGHAMGRRAYREL